MGANEGTERNEAINAGLSPRAQALFDLIWYADTGEAELRRVREQAFALYDSLTEEEQENIDESMIMEHLSMMLSCYGETASQK